MRVQLPTPRQVAGLLGLPFVKSESGVSDTATDPGFFGPDSVTWKVMREPFLVLGGGRAVLMQVAHPLVAAGVLHHSEFEADPFGRLLRTANWTSRVAFGTRTEAIAACRDVNNRHRTVEGDLPAGAETERVAAGTHYTARDADLARWVHATLVDTLLVTYEALAGALTPAEADTFVREWNQVARRVGVAPDGGFGSRIELTDYIRDQLENGPVMCGPGSRKVAESLLTSPLAVTKPAWPALTFFSVGLLPDTLRRQFGMPWSPARQLAMRGIFRATREARGALPQSLRISATARFAMRRAAGEMEDRGVA